MSTWNAPQLVRITQAATSEGKSKTAVNLCTVREIHEYFPCTTVVEAQQIGVHIS